MHGFAGVVVLRENLVLLIQEPDYFTGEPRWTFPSGHIEPGEEPAAAAARELAEESGCSINPAALELIATADVRHRGEELSRSWNFTATTTELALLPDDPDRTVTGAEWIERAEAIRLLSSSTYAPKVEPATRFLAFGDRNLHWTFELVDPSVSPPSFRWQPPLAPTSPRRQEDRSWQ
jgi:8-oxo-dGTP pyrophosphatase MutT (NUDIX family)